MECIETVHQLFIDFRKDYDSVRLEVLYSVLTEFGVPMELQGGVLVCRLGPQLCASQRPVHHLLGGAYEFCQ
jgi:hypothetical protein